MAYDIKEMDIFIDRGANGSLAKGLPKKTPFCCPEQY